jgi:hypothetical protein
VPVTAKLSKALYDRLGEQVVNELVDWFNQVDATYRADLRQFNELNFARFDAKLEALKSELTGRFDAKLDALKAELNGRLDAMQSAFEAKLEKRLGEQTRFFFLAWAILLASNIALWFR